MSLAPLKTVESERIPGAGRYGYSGQGRSARAVRRTWNTLRVVYSLRRRKVVKTDWPTGCRAVTMALPPSAYSVELHRPPYTGTPEIGPVPRLFTSDFTPGKDFAAVSAAAAWLAFSTMPQSRTLPSVTVTLTR